MTKKQKDRVTAFAVEMAVAGTGAALIYAASQQMNGLSAAWSAAAQSRLVGTLAMGHTGAVLETLVVADVVRTIARVFGNKAKPPVRHGLRVSPQLK